MTYEPGGSIPAKLAQARRPDRQFTCAPLPTPQRELRDAVNLKSHVTGSTSP